MSIKEEVLTKRKKVSERLEDNFLNIISLISKNSLPNERITMMKDHINVINQLISKKEIISSIKDMAETISNIDIEHLAKLETTSLDNVYNMVFAATETIEEIKRNGS